MVILMHMRIYVRPHVHPRMHIHMLILMLIHTCSCQAILMFCILSLTDEKSAAPSGGACALAST